MHGSVLGRFHALALQNSASIMDVPDLKKKLKQKAGGSEGLVDVMYCHTVIHKNSAKNC